jgi:hypothetical protein
MPKEFKFTFLDYVAFTLYLDDARRANQHPPAWMCASEEVREEWRVKAEDHLRPVMVLGITRDGIEKTLSGVPAVAEGRRRWEEHERRLEIDRENHNPTAYFIHT